MAVGGLIALPELATTPSVPAPGSLLFYTKTDGNAYILNSSGVESVIGSVSAITGLTGDVSATGPGDVSATVDFVGGQAAATIAASVVEVGAATATNVVSTIVKRDSAGNFAAGTITATLNGNASTASSAVTAISFTGSLAGDVTGTQSATVVSLVGGQSASNIAAATAEVLAAASINTPGTLVIRDGTGSFVAGTIIATFSGNLTGNVTGNVSGSSASFTGSLAGDVSGTQSATVVQKIQGVAVNSITPTDAQIFIYNSTSNQWNPISISGDVALNNSGSTSIASTTVTGKLLTGYIVGASTPILATDSILGAFEKVQAQLNASSSSAITALTGDGTATGPGSVPFTLATVNSNVGSFGSQTQVATFTVNGKGLITAASNVTIGNLTNSNLSGSAGITGANIASSTISNINLAQMAANTVKANTSGVPANPVDTTLGTTTEVTSSVLILTGWTDATIGSPTIQVLQATTSESGYLSSTDWNTFNNKQTAGNYITALTGDGTAAGPGSAAFTLATVNPDVGSFGSSTAIPTVTVNGKGLITAITTNVVVAPAGTLTGTTLASNVVSSSLTSVGTITSGVWNGTPLTAPYMLALADNEIYVGSASNQPAAVAMSGDVAIVASGATTIQTNVVSNSKLAQMPGNTVKANTSGVTANASDVALGTLTETTSAVLSLVGWTDATIGSPTIQVHQATTSVSGYLSSTDWNTFNNKQTAGNYITAITGDVTATGPGSVAATVAKIQGNTVSGTTGTVDVVFSASPTLTGTLTAAIANFSGAVSINDAATGALIINTTSFVFDSTNNAFGINTQPATNVMIDGVNISGVSKLVQMTGYGVGSTTGYRGRFARGTLGTPSAVQSGDVLSAISGRGYGTSQFAVASTGVVNIVAGETFSNTSNLTYLQFSTTPTGSVTSAESMRVASTGVTLGPQSASTALHTVNGGWLRTTKTITANYTVDTTTSDDIILCNQSAGITITLPTATVGRTVVIKDISGNAQTNPITVVPAVGTTNIEGLNANKVLYTNFGSWTFSVGSAGNWWMV